MRKLCMILPLALILCFIVGCQNQEAMAELEEFKAKAEIEEQNKAIVLRLLEEMDKQNFGILDELFADDIKCYASGSFEPLDKETTKQLIAMFYGSFPDYTHTIEDVIAKDDRVVIRCIYRGTHKEEFMGIPATEKTIEYGGIHIWQVKDGKLVEGWVYEDLLLMMQQIGMELKPKEAEK